MTLKTWRTLVGKLIQGLAWSGGTLLALVGLTGTANADPAGTWVDGFEAYTASSQLHGQGGWKGWDDSSGAGALVSDAVAHTGTKVAAIVGDSDLVHEYSGATAGCWAYTAWQFIPENFSGTSYFIMLNTYEDSGPYNWSVQVSFSSSSSKVVSDDDNSELPLIKGRWVRLRVEIDLDNDVQKFFYDGQLLYQKSWTDGVSGDGALNVGAVDLYANGSSVVYYDDLSLVPVAPLPAPTITPNGGNFAAPQEVTIAVSALYVLQDPPGTPNWAKGVKHPSEPLMETVVALSNDGEHTMALRASTDVGDDWYVFAGVNMSRTDGAIFPLCIWNLTYSEGEYPADLFVGVTTSTWTGSLYDFWYGETGNRVFLILYENSQSTGLTWPVLYSCADDEDQELDSQIVASYPPIPVSALASYPLQLDFDDDQVRVLYDDLPLLSDETDNDGWVVYTGDSESGRVTAALDPDDMRFWVTLAGGYMPGQRAVTIADTPPIVVRYTSDNSPVTVTSPLVTGPLWIGDNTTIRARAYSDPFYASAEAFASFTSTITEFRLPTTSQTSPLCVEGWRQDGTSKNLTVTVNGGTPANVTFVGDADQGARLWFCNASLSATGAVTIAVKDNGTTIKSEDVIWTATDLTGSSGSLSIRQGDSLLLTASGSGSLDIDTDGDDDYEITNQPAGTKFATAYDTAGTYIVKAKINGSQVGTLTLTVVHIAEASAIGIRTGDDRTKDLTVTPSSAASQVVIQAPEPGVAQLASQTTTGSGVQVVLHADGTGTAGIAARLGGATGPILRAYGTHSFTITLVKPNLLCIVLWYENGDVLVPAALQMTPHYSGHQLQLHSLSGGLFEDSSGTTFWAPTGNFDAHGQYTYYMISTSPPTVCHKLGGVQE